MIFEISRDVCTTPGTWECCLDFLPHVPLDALRRELIRRRQTPLTTEDLLTGILHNRLGRVLTQAAGLDFLPHVPLDALRRELIRRRQTPLTTEDLLTGILHNRLGRVLTQAAGIRGRFPLADLMDSQIDEICKTVKDFSISLKEPLGMDSAQVTAGGILTDDFDPATMQSRLVPGLFACGEVLDVDGDCGGYNLQWAWSSGRLAGENAGKENI